MSATLPLAAFDMAHLEQAPDLLAVRPRLQGLEPTEGFGVAPSALRYRRSPPCAQ